MSILTKKRNRVLASLILVLIICWSYIYLTLLAQANVAYDISGDVRFREAIIKCHKDKLVLNGVILNNKEKEEIFALLSKVHLCLAPKMDLRYKLILKRKFYCLDSCVKRNERYFWFNDSGDLMMFGVPMFFTSGLSSKEYYKLKNLVKSLITRVEMDPIEFKLLMYDVGHKPMYRYSYTNEIQNLKRDRD